MKIIEDAEMVVQRITVDNTNRIEFGLGRPSGEGPLQATLILRKQDARHLRVNDPVRVTVVIPDDPGPG